MTAIATNQLVCGPGRHARARLVDRRWWLVVVAAWSGAAAWSALAAQRIAGGPHGWIGFGVDIAIAAAAAVLAAGALSATASVVLVRRQRAERRLCLAGVVADFPAAALVRSRMTPPPAAGATLDTIVGHVTRLRRALVFGAIGLIAALVAGVCALAAVGDFGVLAVATTIVFAARGVTAGAVVETVDAWRSPTTSALAFAVGPATPVAVFEVSSRAKVAAWYGDRHGAPAEACDALGSLLDGFDGTFGELFDLAAAIAE